MGPVGTWHALRLGRRPFQGETLVQLGLVSTSFQGSLGCGLVDTIWLIERLAAAMERVVAGQQHERREGGDADA